MIKNGRPFSYENGWIDDALITTHSKEEIEMVCNWIIENIYPRQTPTYEKTSYNLKHVLERDKGIYLTNNEFKDAMLMCGFEPINVNKLNWVYCISKKSPVFKL